MNDRRSIFAHGALLVALIASIVFLILHAYPTPAAPDISISTSTPPVTTSEPEQSTATTSPSVIPESTTTVVATTSHKAQKARIQAVKAIHINATTSPNDIVRIEIPYPNPPLAFEVVNNSARAALVNIYCFTRSEGALKPITGSGIVVDPRGVVLTNAHVAQYVLIAQSRKTDLQCVVRTGAPAVSKWIPVVLYMPPIWIETHAADILKSHALGTGEHDYALLYLISTLDGSPLPASFPYVAPDVREAIAFVDDNVLAASYPVEFEGGSIVQSNLYPVTSITAVRQLLTFSVGKADAISLGGIIGAQSGSSGGGVVNQWNRAVGLITTTSDGATTAERDLHAITTAYINRDLINLTGKGLSGTLAADPKRASEDFEPIALGLAQKLIAAILLKR